MNIMEPVQYVQIPSSYALLRLFKKIFGVGNYLSFYDQILLAYTISRVSIALLKPFNNLFVLVLGILACRCTHPF